MRIPAVRTCAVWILLLVLIGGCAQQRSIATYEARQDKMEYESDHIALLRQLSDRGYGNSSSLMMRARATCSGEGCTPDVVYLVFSVTGNTNVGFQNQGVRITADGESYTWEDPLPLRNDEVYYASSAGGQLARVRLRPPALEQIANAESVNGYLGGRAFDLDDRQKEKLRRFVSVLGNPSAQQNPET